MCSSSNSLQHFYGPCSVQDIGKLGLSSGAVRITDLSFQDDAVIFTETTEVLAEALESLSEEAQPLGLLVSWIKTKVFGDILHATI